RARNQHNAITQSGYVLQLCRQIEVGKRRDSAGDYPHHDCASAALHEGIHTKSRGPSQAVRNVARTLVTKIAERVLVIADQFGSNVTGVVRGERSTPDWFKFSVNF